MKRFHWPLQRLLMVTTQREQGLRMEVFALAQECASMRRQLAHRQALLRQALAELATHDLQQRMPRMEVFLKASVGEERQLDALKAALAELDAKKKRKTEDLMKARASRKTLERLRTQALAAHLREQMRLEQKQFDENAHVSFARRMASQRESA